MIEGGLPIWLYVVMVTSAGMIAWTVRAVIRTILDAKTDVLTGDMVPRVTVDLLVRRLEEEIKRLEKERDHWMTAFHLKDSAYTTLAQSVDDFTDVMRTAGQQQSARAPEGPNVRRRSGSGSG